MKEDLAWLRAVETAAFVGGYVWSADPAVALEFVGHDDLLESMRAGPNVKDGWVLGLTRRTGGGEDGVYLVYESGRREIIYPPR